MGLGGGLPSPVPEGEEGSGSSASSGGTGGFGGGGSRSNSFRSRPPGFGGKPVREAKAGAGGGRSSAGGVSPDLEFSGVGDSYGPGEATSPASRLFNSLKIEKAIAERKEAEDKANAKANASGEDRK